MVFCGEPTSSFIAEQLYWVFTTQEAPKLPLTLDDTTKARFIALATTPQGESATTPVGRALQKHAARPRGAFAGATGDAVRSE
jgi:hypothetical protein